MNPVHVALAFSLTFVAAALAQSPAVTTAVTPARDSRSADRPHVVLIMTDDMGWRDLHCQGNDRLRTPKIDALCAEGVRFTDAYAASPVCSPTRAALMTGLAPARLNITQHGADSKGFWPADRKITPPDIEHILPLESVTVAERLREAGYATGFFGKWHLSGTSVKKDDPSTGGEAFYPDRQGYDVNVGGCGRGGPPTYFDPYRIPTLEPRKEGEYLTDRLADETVRWMDENHGQPMFVTLWTYNPHYPFEAPADLIPGYEGKEGPGLVNPIYGAQIEATDRAIGRVLEKIDSLGIKDNTLVIFTSDNGGWSGATDNRPLREGKGYLYEGGIRVPLIIRWPGVTKAGTTSGTPVVSMDLTATILEAANVSVDASVTFDGASLKAVLEGNDSPRAPLVFHYPHWAFHKSNRPGSAIRDGDHKLIYRYDDDSVELYDLASDLGESKNLAASMPERAAALKSELLKALEGYGARLPTAAR